MTYLRISRSSFVVKGVLALAAGCVLGGCATSRPPISPTQAFAAEIARLNKAVDAQPTNAKAYFERAFYEQFIGDANAAMADYTKALDLGLDASWAFDASIKLGALCFDTGRYEQAIATYTRALGILGPKATWRQWQMVYFGRSRSYALNDDVEHAAVDRQKAMMLLEAERKAQPTVGEQVARGVISGLIGGVVGGAVGAATGQAVTSPATATTGYAAGDTVNRILSGDRDRGADVGDAGVSITDGERAAIYELRGAYRSRKGDDRALDDYARALELATPGDVTVSTYLGRAGFKAVRGERDAALSDLAKADALSLGSASADRFVLLVREGDVYDALGDYDEAIRRYDSALKLAPANPKFYPDRWLFVGRRDLYFQRGRAYCKKGDYKRAIADFTKTLERGVLGGVPSRDVYYQRWIAYRRRGDEVRAASDLDMAIRLGYRVTADTQAQ